MKGCSAQDGDLEWSDSCTWLLPAHPCRFEISSHPTSSKNTVTKAGNSSSWPSINPNTLRFLLLSCSAATILSPSSTFYCCRLYHLHCSFAMLLHCSSVSLTRLHRWAEVQEPECVWVERRTRRRVSSSGNRIFGRGGERTYFEATRVGWKQSGTAIRPLKITVLIRTAFHQKLIKTGRLTHPF